MYKRRLIGLVALAMIFGVVGAMMSCNSDPSVAPGTTNAGVTVSSESADTITPDAAIPSDQDGTCYGEFKMDVYDSTLGRAEVIPFVEAFEEEGFVFDRDFSFVQEGDGVPEWTDDTIHVRFITLAMSHPGDPDHKAAFVQYVHSEVGAIISPYVIAFSDSRPGPAFVEITSGIWQESRGGVVIRSGKRAHEPVNLNVYEYLACVMMGTMSRCADAMSSCAQAPIVFPVCAAIGCATALLESTIICALSVWG